MKAHLVADVPVGVLLSGGIDSSALAAIAARESSYRVSTFSIGFEERSFNELEQARQIAELYGTDHHELIVRPDADSPAALALHTAGNDLIIGGALLEGRAAAGTGCAVRRTGLNGRGAS